MKKQSIFRQLILNIVLPLTLLIFIVSVFYLVRTLRVIKTAQDDRHQILIEEITKLIEFQDISIESVEENLTQRMREFSNLLVKNEFSHTNNIESADLFEIRNRFQVDFDIYIINSKGEIINTTFIRDLGFNLFNIDNAHQLFLEDIMLGSEFVAEKLSIEKQTGKLKKYTYQPTKDNRYIIELGSYSPRATQLLNAFKRGLNELQASEQMNIEAIDLFISKENKKSLISDSEIDSSHMNLYTLAFDQKTRMDTVLKENGKYLLYKYVYFKREHTGLYEGSVLRIISDISGERKFIQRQILFFTVLLIITILLIIFLSINRAKSLTEPIVSLLNTVRNISSGDLTKRANDTGTNEIAILARHFNSMVDNLESLYKDLEQKVKERTIQLVEQKEELEKLSIVASETDNAVIIMDRNGNFEWVNQAFERMYGLNLQKLIQQRGGNILTASTNNEIKLHFQTAIQEKKTTIYESKTLVGNQEIWAQTTLTPIINSNNIVNKVIAIDSDISKIKSAERELSAQHEIVVEQKKNITDSIQYAKKIQQAVLPPKELIRQWIPNHFILFKPRDIVSGDFYWATKKSEKIIIAAADCTGHGVPGGFMSMLGVAFLNEIVNRIMVNKHVYSLEAAEILNQLRTKVIDSLHQKDDSYEAKDGMDIALCIIDYDKKELQFAGANNPLYLIRDNELSIFKGDRMSISIDRNVGKPFTNHIIEIKDDDMLYIFSDGYADQFGGKNLRKYKSRTLREKILSIHGEELHQQKKILEEEFYNWKGDYRQIDDVLLIGIQVTPGLADEKKKEDDNFDWANKEILIAEDTELNYILLVEVLRKTNAKVSRAINGREAVEMALMNDYDLILMDINMPEMDGFEATQIIKAKKPRIPIVAQTALSMADAETKAKLAGCDDYFTKPIQMKRFFDTIKKFM